MNGNPVTLHDLAGYYSGYLWFAALWTTSLAIVCGVALTLVPRAAAPSAEPDALHARSWPDPASSIAVAALAAFVVGHVCLAFYHDDLVGLDFAQLTARQFVRVPIMPDNGRFFPLGMQEYNLLNLIGRTATVYHVFSALELVVVLGCLVRAFDAQPVWRRCVVIAAVVTLPSFVTAFFGFVIPERDMMLWLGLWLVCYESFIRRGGRVALCGVLVAAQFLLYYKETAFVLVGGAAAGRLLIDWWQRRPAERSTLARFLRDHTLELLQLALCVVFLATYYAAVASHVRASYVASGGINGTIAAFVRYAETDYVLDLFVLVFVCRAGLALTRKIELDALWDPAAFGALAYGLAYVKLGLVRGYYMAPVDVVGVIYVARAVFAWYDTRRQTSAWIAVPLMAVAIGVLADNISEAAYDILGRKEFVEANSELEIFLNGVAPAQHDGIISLYFPRTGGFQIMELSSFLQYKGLTRFGVASAHRYPDDLCHPSQAFRCVFQAAPASGDFVVFLPGWRPSAAELEALRANGREVLHHVPTNALVERILRTLIPASREADLANDVYVFEVAR